jgi:hypothetical protein
MGYQSNRGAVEALLDQAIDNGLRAAGPVLINAIKEGYNPPHYFTGWAAEHGKLTGNLLNSPVMTEPHDDGDGRAIRVFTNYKVAEYWEVGFNQRLWVWYDEKLGRWFSRPGPTRFVRYEVWRPAFLRTLDEQRAAFERVFLLTMEAA